MKIIAKNTLTAALLTTALSSLAYGADFKVQNNGDAGLGSLRQAIIDAN